MVGGHLGGDDGPALFLHLLGKLGTGELRGRSIALHVKLTAHRAARRGAIVKGGYLDVLPKAKIRLLAKGRKQGAQPDAGGSEIGDFVYLEHGVYLARGLQNLLHLIGGKSVKATAEGIELD